VKVRCIWRYERWHQRVDEPKGRSILTGLVSSGRPDEEQSLVDLAGDRVDLCASESNRNFNLNSKLMYGELAPFIENPVLEEFLKLRAGILVHPDFDPDADDLASVDELVAAGEFGAVIEKTRAAIWPNFLLSPGAHVQLGFALQKEGREREANVERAIAALLMRGIELTGDGSESAPFLVSRTSDEYDYLFAQQLEFASYTEVESEGRELDCILVRDKGPLFFDVTDICRIRRARSSG
jgi:hypothetical protein